jgi:HK97 family phage major capsid protein
MNWKNSTALGAGGIAWLAASQLGPRIAFEKPNDGTGGREDVEKLAKEVKEKFDKQFADLKAIAEDALGKVKAGETLTAATKEKADEALLKVNGLVALKEQVAQLEQKVLEGGGGKPEKTKSMGELFVEDAKVKEFLGQAEPARPRRRFQVKTTLTSLTTAAGGSVGDAIRPTACPESMPLAQRRLTVRDLLSQGQMDGSTLEYVKETGFTNNAGMVAEGAPSRRPTSSSTCSRPRPRSSPTT